jgi:hypothetical protein
VVTIAANFRTRGEAKSSQRRGVYGNARSPMMPRGHPFAALLSFALEDLPGGLRLDFGA